MDKENDIKKWFIDKEFLKCNALERVSVSEFIFRTSRDSHSVLIINEMYDEFMMNYLEDALENGGLPIDMVLDLVAIDDLVEYMKAKFLTVVKVDNTLLNDDAISLFIDILCDSHTFFSIFKGKHNG